MTHQSLDECITYWISVLGLQEWDIAWEFSALKPKTTTARCFKSGSYKRARILFQPWVLRKEPPKNWHRAADCTFDEQIEITAIHELLHLVVWEMSSSICLLADYAKTSAYEVAFEVQEEREELMVDQLSRALYNAKRLPH